MEHTTQVRWVKAKTTLRGRHRSPHTACKRAVESSPFHPSIHPSIHQAQLLHIAAYAGVCYLWLSGVPCLSSSSSTSGRMLRGTFLRKRCDKQASYKHRTHHARAHARKETAEKQQFLRFPKKQGARYIFTTWAYVSIYRGQKGVRHLQRANSSSRWPTSRMHPPPCVHPEHLYIHTENQPDHNPAVVRVHNTTHRPRHGRHPLEALPAPQPSPALRACAPSAACPICRAT